jgi:hypothetical protein
MWLQALVMACYKQIFSYVLPLLGLHQLSMAAVVIRSDSLLKTSQVFLGQNW